MPFSYGVYSSAPVAVEGYETAPEEQPTVDYSEVGPGYLATMGIPLVSGREFTRADNETAPLVAVVNETMAAQFWRGQDPVGRRFQMQGKWVQVAGVARMSKYRSLTEVAKPFFYVPVRQTVDRRRAWRSGPRCSPETLARRWLGRSTRWMPIWRPAKCSPCGSR